MGHTGVVAHDPSAPAGHLPALRAGRNMICPLLYVVLSAAKDLTERPPRVLLA